MNTSFKEGALEAAIRPVAVLDARIPGTPIITGEDNKRVVLKAGRFQFRQDVANAPVELADHRAINALAMVLDLR